MMDEPHIRILMVEDDPDAAELLREVLSDHFKTRVSLDHAASLGEARAKDPDDYDIVLSDMNLPDGKGLELIETFLARRPDLPMVMVTTENVTETAAEALRLGAYDYVVKAGDYLFSLPLVVQKNLTLWRAKHENERLENQLQQTLRELRDKNEKLETIAATDPLTGVANRRAFNLQLEKSFADANRHGRDMALLMADLDGFKQLNDTMGHPFGDRILERTSRVLEANCRRYDVPGRLGGDEFVLLLPRTDQDTAVAVAQRVYEEFVTMADNECRAAGYDGKVTISLGVSSLGAGRAANATQLVAQADQALYAAKNSGKARVTGYPMNAEV